MIKVDKDIEINPPDFNDPRIMAIDMRIYGFNIRVVNGYSTTNIDGSVNGKDLFYRNLKKACMKNQKHQKLIVIGDFNAETGLANYKSCYDGVKTIMDNDCNDNGSRLKSFCRKLKLCLSSTFFDHSIEYRYTWYSNDHKTKKIIDHVLVEKFTQEYITNCIVQLDYDFDTDHRLLTTTLRTPCTRKARRKPKRPPRKPMPNKKTLIDPSVRKRYVQTVETTLQRSHSSHTCTTKMSENIIHALSSAATVTLPKTSGPSTNHELWKNDELLNQLLNDRSSMTMGSPEYKRITKKIKQRIGMLRNDKLRKEAEEINEYANLRQIEDLFRKIKSDGSTFRNTKQKSMCEPEKLQHHFMKHFKPSSELNEPIELMEAPFFIQQLQEIETDTIDTSPPNQIELIAVLKRLKNGKTSTDIHAEFLKYAVESKELIIELENMYKTIWTTHTIPKSWRHSKLVTIWKGSSKGSIKDPATYRGLQVGSTLCKIMTIIIINRISKWYELQLLDQQQGFRSGRGTADGIYIVKRIQQITDKMRKPTFLLFVDLTAAFDHIKRQWLFKTIYQRIPDQTKSILQLLETLYEFTTTSLAETPTNTFEILLGVRQGGPESPPLFNLYMDYVMRLYMERCKNNDVKFLDLQYRIPSTATTREDRHKKTDKGNHEADWAGYADDLTLIFDDERSLQKLWYLITKQRQTRTPRIRKVYATLTEFLLATLSPSVTSG